MRDSCHLRCKVPEEKDVDALPCCMRMLGEHCPSDERLEVLHELAVSKNSSSPSRGVQYSGFGVLLDRTNADTHRRRSMPQ